MALGGASYKVGARTTTARVPKPSPRPGFLLGRYVEVKGTRRVSKFSYSSSPQPILLKHRVQPEEILRYKCIFTQGAVLPRANQSPEQREKVITEMVH